jgi:hypothetical protein
MPMKERVYNNSDLSYLRKVAEQIGPEINVPSDIRQAQNLRDTGVPVPGDLDPEEAYLLSKITQEIVNGANMPRGLIIYLNDRTDAQIPEGTSQGVERMRKVAFNELVDVVKQLNSKTTK